MTDDRPAEYADWGADLTAEGVLSAAEREFGTLLGLMNDGDRRLWFTERAVNQILAARAAADEEGRGRLAADMTPFLRALLGARIECPVHGIPDCSPLLNGCSIPRHIAEWRGEFMTDLRAAVSPDHGQADSEGGAS